MYLILLNVSWIKHALCYQAFLLLLGWAGDLVVQRRGRSSSFYAGEKIFSQERKKTRGAPKVLDQPYEKTFTSSSRSTIQSISMRSVLSLPLDWSFRILIILIKWKMQLPQCSSCIYRWSLYLSVCFNTPSPRWFNRPHPPQSDE